MSDQDLSNHQEVQVGDLDKGAVEDPAYVEKMLKKAEAGTDTTGETKRQYAGKYADPDALKQGAENLVKMKLSKMTPEEAESFYNQMLGKKSEDAPAAEPETETKAEEAEEAKPEAEEEPVEDEKTPEGLNMTRMQDEWLADGKLSDESMAELAKAGFGKGEVDTYMAGLEVQLNKTFAKAGGKESYFQMIDWAGKNLPDSEIDAFNATMQTHSLDSITLAVEGLHAKYVAANGKDPARRIEGGDNTPTALGFNSKAEMVEAMKDPRYGKDRAYTQRIEQQVFQSRF